ncbi:MAG: hypothetical protein KVP17_001543 [Porospora cf. gigantea B]|uniref:uncharacterized protein n=1 Tax=Porospora cf. gigantea B TaxID=2853592 RepID=UPI00357189E0|nr:MAG: hypothetical protein KVP17_001543 [Porospora cf. gigantea B]
MPDSPGNRKARVSQKGIQSRFVDVMHGINGWRLHASFDEKFNVVVWNQPHLGVEDFRLHKSLLAHFFHSALKVLRPHGVIVVSLENRQYHRWGFESVVERQGLTVLARNPFDPRQFPGYESKRNDNPQSFQNTGTRRHTGSMMSGCVVVVGSGSILVQPTPVSPRPQRDRLKFNCPDCAASYGCAQAVRTHWSQYHKKPVVSQSQRECVLCPGRLFKNDEAYTQHMAATHGRSDKIPLSVAVVAPALPVTDAVCEVCGLPAQTMEAHLQLLLPRLLVNLECSACDKTFRDERALKQHENFCTRRPLDST